MFGYRESGLLEEFDERAADLRKKNASASGGSKQIPETTRPKTQELAQREVERLRKESEQQKSILQDCLAHIDQSILNCRAQIDAYRQTRSDLVALNERLAKLGVAPVVVPDHFPSENLGDLILARLDRLQAKAKI